MGDGSSGGATQTGAQRGITLAGSPSWASGDRLMPQSMMQAMAVPTSIPSAPGTQVIAPPAPQTASQTPVASIPQSPLSMTPWMSSQTSDTLNQPTSSSLKSGDLSINNPTGDTSGTTQGANPVSFQMAKNIQSLLPQVQSDHAGSPASNANVNVAQSPSQPNPVASQQMSTHDQALEQGLEKTFSFEGPELTQEPNGTNSVWGIGASPGEPIPKTKDQAKQYFVQHYINNNPARSEIMNQLNTPQDVNAYAQYVINAPKKVDAFNENWRGQFGGDEWRNAMLNTQARHYNNLVTSDPKKWGQYMDGWTDRINQSRNWNPQKPGNT